MKLTELQITELKTLVSGMVDYHESYQELYDHIFTALEKKDQDTELLDAVDAIVDEDFGGYERLFKTEDERQKIVKKQILKKQQRNFVNYFKPPIVVLTIAIGYFFYFATNNFLSLKQLSGIIMIVAFLPILFLGIRGMIVSQWVMDKKRSIKEGSIFTLASFSQFTMQSLVFFPKTFLKDDDIATFVQLHSAVIAMLFTVYVVYVLSFFKLYRQEFKMQLTR